MRIRSGTVFAVAVGVAVGMELGHRFYDQIMGPLNRAAERGPLKTVTQAGRDIMDATADAAKERLADGMATASGKIRSFAGEVEI